MSRETGKTPREAAEEYASKRRTFMAGQGEVLRQEFNNMGLEKTVDVEKGTKLVRAEEFDNVATIGLVSDRRVSYPFAFFASAVDHEKNVKVVLVAPSEDKSGLIVDDKGTIVTDSFWEAKRTTDEK